jgi:predicted XRE-type DNA-binding protein
MAHRVVWEKYYGDVPVGYIIHHKDGNKQNNHVENLEWVTDEENKSHAIRTGLIEIRRGEKSNFAKLKAKDVYKIADLLKEGKLKQVEIAKLMNISTQTISSINVKGVWKHLKY